MSEAKVERLKALIKSNWDLDDLANSIVARNTEDEYDELITFLERGEVVTMQELILYSIDLKRARKE